MNFRKQFLTDKLSEFLSRKSVPKALGDDAKAQQGEINKLLHCLMRYAPKGDEYGDWWASLEDYLEENSETRGWPRVAEFARGAKAVSKSGMGSGHSWEPDPIEINARRMNNGEAVGEHCVYGLMAVELQHGGHVSQAVINQYRSGLYFAARDVLGEDAAKRREADNKKKHALAEAAFRSKQLEAAK